MNIVIAFIVGCLVGIPFVVYDLPFLLMATAQVVVMVLVKEILDD